jgi:hypothetical protein
MEKPSKESPENEFVDHLLSLLHQREEAFQRYERRPTLANLEAYYEVKNIVEMLGDFLTLDHNTHLWN